MIVIKNIVITAGGTSEPIDGVRRISNTSTGSLCAHIYEALSGYLVKNGAAGNEYTVHYVAPSNALKPVESPRLPIVFHTVTDVASTVSALRELAEKTNIDYFIHGMAVSDFTKGYLIEKDTLIDKLTARIEEAVSAGMRGSLRETVASVIDAPDGALRSSRKLSSRSELVLSLVRTPKIIGMIKAWAPDAFLVGFKLLKGVSEDKLLAAATGLADANGCDMVLANDADRIDGKGHFGMLIKGGRVIGRYATKKEIAEGIVENMLSGK